MEHLDIVVRFKTCQPCTDFKIVRFKIFVKQSALLLAILNQSQSLTLQEREREALTKVKKTRPCNDTIMVDVKLFKMTNAQPYEQNWRKLVGVTVGTTLTKNDRLNKLND